MKKTVVAFDFGASSGRAIAGTYQDGRLEYKEVHRFDNIPVDDDGRMCHNFPAICKEVDAALSKMNSADGLSFDTWGVDYGLLNKSGNLLRLPCHYRDTRTAGTVEKVLKKIPADNLYRATGNQIMEINTLFQLTTEDTAGAEKLLFMPDLFAHHLCGSMQTEPTIASTSQLLDPVNQTWRTDIAKACGIDPQLLPAVGPSATVLGKTDGGIQVIATAGHDTQFAIFGSGADKNQPVLSSGTWEILMARSAQARLTREDYEDGATAEFDAESGLLNPGLQWLGSGIIEWVKAACFHGESYDTMDAEADAVPPGCDGVTMVPDFLASGDRKGSINGLVLGRTRGHIYRAAMEALTWRLKSRLRRLESVGGFKSEFLILVGGGARNSVWTQMRADILRIPVKVSEVSESTVLGASMFAFAGAGVYSTPEQARDAFGITYRTYMPGSQEAAYEKFNQ